MKRLWKKLVGSVVVLLLLSAVFWWYLLFSNGIAILTSGILTKTANMDNLSRSIDKALANYDSASMSAVQEGYEKAALISMVCKSEMAESGDRKPMLYRDGAVVRILEGNVEYPEGIPDAIRINPLLVTDEAGALANYYSSDYDPDHMERYIIYYSHMSGPFYYIEWEKAEELKARQSSFFDLDRSMEGIEKAFNVNFLISSVDKNEEGEHELIYSSDRLPAYRTAEAYGIKPETIDNVSYGSDVQADSTQPSETENTGTPATESTVQNDALVFYDNVEVKGTGYEVMVRRMDSVALEGDYALVCLSPFDDSVRILEEQNQLMLAVFAIICISFLVWFFSMLILVQDYNLDDNQKKEFTPGTIRRRTFAVVIEGTIVIAATCALLLAIFRLLDLCLDTSLSLSTIEWRVEYNKDQSQALEKKQKDHYEKLAVLTAGVLEDDPKLMREGGLQSMCDIMGTDYIMIFDSNGDETLTNSRYKGLSLGKDPASATYEFRRLLNGLPLITYDSGVDEATGMDDVLIGVSFGKEEQEGLYGAMVLAVPREKIFGSTLESTRDILTSVTSEGALAFSVDPESGVILDASSSEYVGSNVNRLGLSENFLNDGYRDFFTIDDKEYYGECAVNSGILYCYAALKNHLYQYIPPFAVSTALCSLIFLVILALYMLFGYKKYFAYWSVRGMELEEGENDIETSKGRHKYSVDPSMRWKTSIRRYGRHAPVHNALNVMQILIIIAAMVIGIRILMSENRSRTSIIGFILDGNWAKGFNLFSFTCNMVLLVGMILAVMLIKLVLGLISSASGARGETICRLLINLVSYAGVLSYIYYALYNFGFKPDTLLASLGLITFAVSLGAKDLITDVIAGISIVFEGEYQVGDIIEVNGYRGEVLEIGVRTTKLEGRGGNIKIIGNKDVKNVLNMTRKNSWSPLEVNVSSEQNLDEVEKLLAQQLPGIGKSIPEIVSGPFYKGVLAIGKGAMTLSIIAECNEEDYYKVQRALNRAVKELFEQNGIRML